MAPHHFFWKSSLSFFFHFLFLFFLLRLPKFFLCLHSLKWKEEFWRALDLNCNSKFEKKPIHCKERKRGGRAEGRFHKKRQKSSQNTASFERSSSRSSTRQQLRRRTTAFEEGAMKNSVLPDFFGNMCAKYYWNWSAIDEKMYDFNLMFFEMSDPTQNPLNQMVISNGCTT